MQAENPQLLALTNPESNLFGSVFSVYVAGGVIGFAVVCQPHLLTKALYLEHDRDVRRFIHVSLAVTVVFFTLLLAGLAAHATLAPGVPQDRVMATWLAGQFDGVGYALISVALVAAGMSTLDGILVATSTIAANDLFLPIAEHTRLAGGDPEARARLAWRFGQGTLVVMGVVAYLLCLDPPKLLGIFGQVGVYGLLAAAVGPVLIGVLARDAASKVHAATAAALVGAGVHFGLYLGGFDPNPAVTATWGILAAALVVPFADAMDGGLLSVARGMRRRLTGG